MSALPPKADIRTQSRDVRFVPKAHSRAAPNNAWLVRLATGRNYCIALSAGDLSTEKEICRDRSGNGLFLGWHFKAR